MKRIQPGTMYSYLVLILFAFFCISFLQAKNEKPLAGAYPNCNGNSSNSTGLVNNFMPIQTFAGTGLSGPSIKINGIATAFYGKDYNKNRFIIPKKSVTLLHRQIMA
jgi:hypothetical protein